MANVTAGGAVTPAPMTKEEKKVIFASSLGTVFEWYDFYLYGSLAAVIAKQFFSGVNETAAYIFALLAFAAGFAVRPFGALVFGRLGDMIGRKYTFLVTILIMGASTFIVGILPNYASIGIAAPVILITLRMLQGLALGGEYGGAATYVAEHAPHGRRGNYTAWIQTTATLGLFLSLLVILGCRMSMSAEDFDTWGWRIPFLVSILLLGVSVWIRLMLNESPAFKKMKEEGKHSKAPLTEAFGNWKNLKVVLLALFGLVAGQAVVWYTGQFYALFFLTQTLKVDAAAANLMIAAALLIGTPFFIIFGTLSDRIGRKPIILAGLAIAVITYFPLFKGITHFANPALEQAVATSPIVVVADPAQCSVQFNPVGTSKFTSSCDIAKAALVKKGVPYSNEAAPAGTLAQIRVGTTVIDSYDATGVATKTEVSLSHGPSSHAGPTDPKAAGAAFEKAVADALKAAGYPPKADPAQVNYVMVVVLLTILVIYVTMVYGPIAAMLVEMFPTRIRYTSMSLPYHIGNGWFGGFLPTTSFAIVAATGNIYDGLWYPIIIASVTFVIGALFVKETKDIDIYADD
ncbi:MULTISPECIES: MFS transporter [unclassified Azospirillum]|uniref:MFS transporter n=1 Tax=unclassified Azospirillum TaxID=2630922 RepID=UPI000B6AC007|nr:MULTISPECIES: MFS transporter [unclassified Azospirillum]SNS48794.1 Predicted arabinose efflux permease, MFS family [Azospirillum sp. RU38E]SNS67939.1 Predicted arabinose efflux permease, MFS family [Azospirillum sp. RU37A]